MTTSTGFTSIPVLDLAMVESPETKLVFLSDLREALIVVGFFYLKNTSGCIPPVVQETFVQKSMDLCNQPLEKKLEIDIVNSKHFLGYSRPGCEKTAMKVDHREMFDFLSPLPAPGPDEPVYLNVQGPNQWPDENAVPGFRQAIETYISAMGKLGDVMKILVAEALGLEPTAMVKFFSDPPRNKVSLLKYTAPPSSCDTDEAMDFTDDEFQGVGPHKDGSFLTYLLQATPHVVLEAQNKSGDWISVPPIPDTLGVNVGRSLESMTYGVCTATTHRVNIRPENFFDPNGHPLGSRFAFPLFQTLKPDLTHQELVSVKLPVNITELVKDRIVKSDAEVYFAQYFLESPGIGTFTARLTSHPEVGQRWYPEILARVLEEQKRFKG